ncbi:nuclear transport factor 2 family protein [Ursidibacter arcticus]
MKKVKFWQPLVAILCGICISIFASYPAIITVKVERELVQSEILSLNKRLEKAVLEKNFTTLYEILSDNFEIHSVSQGILTRGEWLGNLQKRGVNYEDVKDIEILGFQGNQISKVTKVRGEFWGDNVDSEIEVTIITVERDGKRQVRRLLIKPVN